MSQQGPRHKGIYLLPNLFTVAAMFAGFYAIVAATKHQFTIAAIAIFISMILDGLDGRVARLTQTQTEFGAQLDSMSDMLCFGVAPALVLYSWVLHSLGKLGWLAAFVYAACTALRLARFNSQGQNEEKRYFYGLATPAAAGLVASMVWVCDKYGIAGHAVTIAVAIFTVLLAILKVSTIRFRSFKDMNMGGSVPFMSIILVVVVLVLVAINPPLTLFTVFFLFALSGPVGLLWGLRSSRKKKVTQPGGK